MKRFDFMLIVLVFLNVSHAHDSWIHTDKLAHGFGMYRVCADATSLWKGNRYFGTATAFAAGFAYEIKDEVFDFRRWGIIGGEAFSWKDFAVNGIGCGLYLAEIDPGWALGGILAINLTYNAVSSEKLFPHNRGWKADNDRRTVKGKFLQHWNSQNSLVIPFVIMSHYRDHSLPKRLLISSYAVVGYELLNGLFTDKDIWYLGDDRGLIGSDILIGIGSTATATLIELLFFRTPGTQSAPPSLVLSASSISLQFHF